MSKSFVTRNQDFLSVEEFSLASSLSASTIRRRIKEGTLPVWQPGGPGTRVLLAASLLTQASEIPRQVASSPASESRPASSRRLPGPRLPWKRR